MLNFSDIKVERKTLAELLFLVIPITILANLFTNYIQSIRSGTIRYWLLIGISILLLAWLIYRVLTSPLFSFRVNKKISLWFIYDKSTQSLLHMRDGCRLDFSASLAFNKLKRAGKIKPDDLPSEDNSFGNSDIFKPVFREVLEYALLGSISQVVFGSWKIENEQSLLGCFWGYSNIKGGYEIKYSDLPAELRLKNIVLRELQNELQSGHCIDIVPIVLWVPPKTRLNYEKQTLTFKNKYITLDFKLDSKSHIDVADWDCLKQKLGQKREKFILLGYDLDVQLRTNSLFVLTPEVEKHLDLAQEFIRRIETNNLCDDGTILRLLNNR